MRANSYHFFELVVPSNIIVQIQAHHSAANMVMLTLTTIMNTLPKLGGMTQPENSNIGIFRIPEELSLDILNLHVNEPILLCLISKHILSELRRPHTTGQPMVPWYSPYEVLGSYNKTIFVGKGQYTMVA